MAMLGGSTLVLTSQKKMDPHEVWSTVVRENVLTTWYAEWDRFTQQQIQNVLLRQIKPADAMAAHTAELDSRRDALSAQLMIDPRTDPIVRVQARNLRVRLARHLMESTAL